MIAAVSSSHTIVEVGSEQTVRIGDVATLIGAGSEAIHPNEVALGRARRRMIGSCT